MSEYMDDAEADMLAMEHRSIVADIIDEMFDNVGRESTIHTDSSGQVFVSTDILYAVAAILSEKGFLALQSVAGTFAGAAYADSATVVNVLALRAEGEEANVDPFQLNQL